MAFMMNRRHLLAASPLLATALAAPWYAGAQTVEGDTRRLSNYLNAIGTLQGSFVQVAPNGVVDEGEFYMRRPGRIRFEYQPPNPTVVIADGFWVAVIDEELEELDRYLLSETPLNILLKENVDLANEGAVTRVERGEGQIRVTAVSPGREEEGSLTMIFTDNPLELRQWIVTDGDGQNTTVALRDTRSNISLSPKLFFIEEPGR
jgi:outer membrane lipoprotein-sorting protein